LDDYPRASPRHYGELHVDLLSWIGVYAKTLRGVAEEIGETEDSEEYARHERNVLSSLDGNSYPVVHKGYISLFPFLLGLLPPDSPHLGPIMDLIEDPQHLWTPYGLASLSKSDPLYGSGENYWRGPIWINVNYLALASLHTNYASKAGPHQQRAQKIYTKLRENIIANVYKEYQRTGYVWEQYSSVDGEGKRSHPFTGWTALVTLIMAEKY
ncbi:Processing alpha glucosidase I, partial [Borealophlyctis nickersoniae]